VVVVLLLLLLPCLFLLCSMRLSLSLSLWRWTAATVSVVTRHLGPMISTNARTQFSSIVVEDTSKQFSLEQADARAGSTFHAQCNAGIATTRQRLSERFCKDGAAAAMSAREFMVGEVWERMRVVRFGKVVPSLGRPTAA
jgi:hypothetical protein